MPVSKPNVHPVIIKYQSNIDGHKIQTREDLKKFSVDPNFTSLVVTFADFALHVLRDPQTNKYEVVVVDMSAEEQLSGEDTRDFFISLVDPSELQKDPKLGPFLFEPINMQVMLFLQEIVTKYLDAKAQRGGANYIKTPLKKHIMGRLRVIYKLGRKQFIKHKNAFVPISSIKHCG